MVTLSTQRFPGVPDPWCDADGNGAHGLNERPEVCSRYPGRDSLYDLAKVLAE